MTADTSPDLPDAETIAFMYALAGEEVWRARFADGRYAVEITDVSRPPSQITEFHVRVSDKATEPTGVAFTREEIDTWATWLYEQPHGYTATLTAAAEDAAKWLRNLAGETSGR